MPGTNARQAGSEPYSSVTGWPSTANSGLPAAHDVPFGGQPGDYPAVRLAGDGEQALVTEGAGHQLASGQVGAHDQGGRHGHGRRNRADADRPATAREP